MEEVIDEKKPFEQDHLVKEEEEEQQPDPDETLMMEQSAGRVWSVKIPKHIMERWSAIDEDDVQLGTIRVYDRDPKRGNSQRIMLLVPPSRSNAKANDEGKASTTNVPNGISGGEEDKPIDVDADDTPSNEPSSSTPNKAISPPSPPEILEEEQYDLDMVNDAVDNQVVIAEREKAPGSRARMTILTGRIKHDCNMRPLFSENYRKRMRERSRAANTPARTVKLMEDITLPGRAHVSTGGILTAPATGVFGNLGKPKPPTRRGQQFERYARMPRNVLLDMLFALYRAKPRWTAKDLRAKTEQPEAYLKEVLVEIADLHRYGEHSGQYELKPNFRDSVKSESGEYSGAAGELIKREALAGSDVEMMDDEDDGDDEDDDMEEIS